MKTSSSKKRGFTLIELMVVIAIIGLLSSIVLAALAGARKKAQLSAVTQQFHQLQNAMELYKIGHSGNPVSSSGTGQENDGSNSNFTSILTNGSNSLVGSKVISKISSSPFPPDTSNSHGLAFGYIDATSMTNQSDWFGCGQGKTVNSYALYIYDEQGNPWGGTGIIEYDLGKTLPTLYEKYNTGPWVALNGAWCLGD